jgi:hypothetical protein
MDTARCLIDGNVYTAIDFSRLPTAQIQALRHDLLCTECNSPAFYRKPSSDGKGPCFGGNPHAETCVLNMHYQDPWGEAGDDYLQRLEVNQTRIVLSFSGDTTRNRADAIAGLQRGTGAGTAFRGATNPNQNRMQRNPEKLLRMLVRVPAFSASQLQLVTEQGEFLIATFFIPFASANKDNHVNQYRGFWGIPHSVRIWRGIYIVNAGPRGSLGFEFTEEEMNALLRNYSLNTTNDLLGANMLIIGTPRESTNRAFLLSVTNVNHVAIVEN